MKPLKNITSIKTGHEPSGGEERKAHFARLDNRAAEVWREKVRRRVKHVSPKLAHGQ